MAFLQVHDFDSVTRTGSFEVDDDEVDGLLEAGDDTGLRARKELYKLDAAFDFEKSSCASGGWSGRSFDFHGVVVNLLKKALFISGARWLRSPCKESSSTLFS